MSLFKPKNKLKPIYPEALCLRVVIVSIGKDDK